jgi:drug/metabolite transporter (DMT)-like permease
MPETSCDCCSFLCCRLAACGRLAIGRCTEAAVNPWVLVSTVVGSTVLGDLLQSFEMKRHGEIQNFHPRGIAKLLATLARKKFLILAIFFMAVSFFAFMTLLETADLSFAVPVSAASLVLETILAKLVLKERVDARRWAGALLVLGGVVLLAQ